VVRRQLFPLRNDCPLPCVSILPNYLPDTEIPSDTQTATCGNAPAGTEAYVLVSVAYLFLYGSLTLLQEDPETSDVWRDLGACDPDVQQSQSIFAKRSTSNIQALDDDNEDTNCRGFVEWEDKATYRSGSTVKHGMLCAHMIELS
jgi:hypothetical protein